jgi:hypothetical protein
MIDRSARRLASFPERLRKAVLRRADLAALALPAVGVIVLAEVGAHLPLRITAVLLTVACAFTRPVFGAGVIVVAASDPSLFRDHAFGALTCVDLLIATVVARAALRADRRHPTWLESSALGFLASGAIATAVAHSGSAPTAFARVSSYLLLGLVVGRAMKRGDRLALSRAFIGSQVGQALAAFASITGTTTTSFAFGRYLGTLGDPAQFGIPIAFAAVLVAVSANIVRDAVLRAALLVLLLCAAAGSATRSAWSVVGVGGLVALAHRLASGRGIRVRVALAIGSLAALIAGTAIVVNGSGAIGLNPHSAELRRHSIDTAWTYLVRHPLHPLGLGNNPRPEDGTDTLRSSNLISNSGFGRAALSRKTKEWSGARTASPHVGGQERVITPIYNTWLAVAISLGIVAAALLAVVSVGAPYHAHRLGNDAVAIALVAILVPSLTENFVYASNFVTLIWLAALGLTVTARSSNGGG